MNPSRQTIAATPNVSARQPWLDAMRGLAMLWMLVFHFCFDLNHFGLWRQNFLGDPFWLVQRTCILSLFLACAGWAQALAAQRRAGRFWRRWLQIVGCALAVSLGSWLMFPDSYISFGVLHGMAVMLLLVHIGAPLLKRPLWVLVLAVLCALAPPLLTPTLPTAWTPVFDGRALNWLGLVSRKPFTQDYVPVLPWLGVMLLGWQVGAWLQRRSAGVNARLPGLLKPLAILGRRPLTFYMLHQPILLGMLQAGMAAYSILALPINSLR